MDAEITNLGSVSPDDDRYIPLGEVQVKAGETITLPDIAIADLDADQTLKNLVLDGDISISLTEDTYDAATPSQGSMSPHGLPKYTVANLPTGYEGRVAFATDGRKTGEASGDGTGVPVYFSGSDWHVFFDDSVVAT